MCDVLAATWGCIVLFVKLHLSKCQVRVTISDLFTNTKSGYSQHDTHISLEIPQILYIKNGQSMTDPNSRLSLCKVCLVR